MNVIVVANQKGGVGKTTVAMQLGAALSRRHRVLVVDTDRQGSVGWWADRSRHHLAFDLTATQSLLALGRIRELEGRYHYVLIDTAGGVEGGALMDTVMDAADFVLVPMTPDPLAFAPTLHTISRLIEPRMLRFSVLLNRIDPCIPHQAAGWCDLLDSVYGIPRFDHHLREYRAHADAPALGDVLTTLPDNRRTRGVIADVTTVGYELEAQFEPALAGRW